MDLVHFVLLWVFERIVDCKYGAGCDVHQWWVEGKRFRLLEHQLGDYLRCVSTSWVNATLPMLDKCTVQNEPTS